MNDSPEWVTVAMRVFFRNTSQYLTLRNRLKISCSAWHFTTAFCEGTMGKVLYLIFRLSSGIGTAKMEKEDPYYTHPQQVLANHTCHTTARHSHVCRGCLELQMAKFSRRLNLLTAWKNVFKLPLQKWPRKYKSNFLRCSARIKRGFFFLPQGGFPLKSTSESWFICSKIWNLNQPLSL